MRIPEIKKRDKAVRAVLGVIHNKDLSQIGLDDLARMSTSSGGGDGNAELNAMNLIAVAGSYDLNMFLNAMVWLVEHDNLTFSEVLQKIAEHIPEPPKDRD